jgi:hypothetical protein
MITTANLIWLLIGTLLSFGWINKHKALLMANWDAVRAKYNELEGWGTLILFIALWGLGMIVAYSLEWMI